MQTAVGNTPIVIQLYIQTVQLCFIHIFGHFKRQLNNYYILHFYINIHLQFHHHF
jgi:hypothetical protein